MTKTEANKNTEEITPEDILKEALLYKKCTDSGEGNRVFGIGLNSPAKKNVRVTIVAQQIRALKLAWALSKQEDLKDKKHFAIVGAGISGITFAAALMHRAIAGDKKFNPKKITIYESASEILHLQYRARSRWVHPYINVWGITQEYDNQYDPKHPTANIPIMNWPAGSGHDVATQILHLWEEQKILWIQYLKQKKLQEVDPVQINSTIIDFEIIEGKSQNDEDKREPFISLSGTKGTNKFRDRCDILVIASGPGREKLVSTLPPPGYWRIDDLEQKYDNRESILISGSGDGAITDLLRCRLKSFSHQNLLRKLDEIFTDTNNLETEIKKIEKSATAEEKMKNANEILEREYLYLLNKDGNNLEANVKDKLREDTSVIFHVRNNPITIKTQPILRLYLALLLRYDHHTELVQSKDIDPIKKEGNHCEVKFFNTNKNGMKEITKTSTFSRIVIRHGIENNHIHKNTLEKTEEKKEETITPKDYKYGDMPTLNEEIIEDLGGIISPPIEIPIKASKINRTDYDNALKLYKEYNPKIIDTTIRLKKLTIKDYKHFSGNIFQLELDEKSNIVTLLGSNGTGKSVILEVLALIGHLSILERDDKPKEGEKLNEDDYDVIVDLQLDERKENIKLYFKLHLNVDNPADLRINLAKRSEIQDKVRYNYDNTENNIKVFDKLMGYLNISYPKTNVIDIADKDYAGNTKRLENHRKNKENKQYYLPPFVSYFNTDVYDYGCGLDIRESPKDLHNKIAESLIRFPVLQKNGELIESNIVEDAWSFLVTGEIEKNIEYSGVSINPDGPLDNKDIYIAIHNKMKVRPRRDFKFKILENTYDDDGNNANADNPNSVQYLSSGKNQLYFLCLILFGMRATGSIFLLDEPELHLSPQAVTRLNVLLGVSAERAKNQFIITTHHPSLVVDDLRGVNYEIKDRKASELTQEQVINFFSNLRHA